jgi:2'-5' RNA ligase
LSTIRSFVAVPLGTEACAALVAVQRELARVAPTVRWIGAELLHVTVKFLGNVAETRVPEMTAALGSALAGTAAFDADVAGLGAFPSASRPRVVWAGIGAGAERAGAIAHTVEAAFEALGFAREERAFRAHVTLARIKDRLPAGAEKALAERLRAEGHRAIARIRVDRVHLMASVLSPKGPTYTPLGTVELGR